MKLIVEMFSYPFLARAALSGTVVSVCAALLGVSLVLKRFSMIGDGLSHIGFGALAIATALNASPVALSIPAVVVSAFLLLRISQNSSVRGDAAIAMISTASLAAGVLAISLKSGINIDISSYLYLTGECYATTNDGRNYTGQYS